VQRTAAWALRQSYSRHPDTPSSDLLAALASGDDRKRWGATRVFAAHFSALGKRSEMTAALAKIADDPAVSVRMNAVKGLWQVGCGGSACHEVCDGSRTGHGITEEGVTEIADRVSIASW